MSIVKTFSLLLFMLLGACQGAAVPLPAATTLPPTATGTSAPLLPLSPATRPTPVATTESNPATYTSDAGRFSLLVPPHTAVYENVHPTVDGLFNEVPNSISIIRTEPNYVLSVRWTAVDPATTLADFITSQSSCVMITREGGETVMLGGVTTRLFDNVACGPFYTAYFYLLHGRTGYVITVDSTTPYRNIADFAQEQLDSFTVLGDDI